MKKPKPPCPPKCPKRVVGCRNECPDWIKYEIEHDAYLREREQQFRKAADICAYQETAARKNMRRKGDKT